MFIGHFAVGFGAKRWCRRCPLGSLFLACELAWTAQAVWLLVAWGYWIDRHRQPRAALS